VQKYDKTQVLPEVQKRALLCAWRRELPRAESGLTKDRAEQEMSRSASSLHKIMILLALILSPNSRRLAATQGELQAHGQVR
jgi:hypothetical protein